MIISDKARVPVPAVGQSEAAHRHTDGPGGFALSPAPGPPCLAQRPRSSNAGSPWDATIRHRDATLCGPVPRSRRHQEAHLSPFAAQASLTPARGLYPRRDHVGRVRARVYVTGRSSSSRASIVLAVVATNQVDRGPWQGQEPGLARQTAIPWSTVWSCAVTSGSALA